MNSLKDKSRDPVGRRCEPVWGVKRENGRRHQLMGCLMRGGAGEQLGEKQLVLWGACNFIHDDARTYQARNAGTLSLRAHMLSHRKYKKKRKISLVLKPRINYWPPGLDDRSGRSTGFLFEGPLSKGNIGPFENPHPPHSNDTIPSTLDEQLKGGSTCGGYFGGGHTGDSTRRFWVLLTYSKYLISFPSTSMTCHNWLINKTCFGDLLAGKVLCLPKQANNLPLPVYDPPLRGPEPPRVIYGGGGHLRCHRSKKNPLPQRAEGSYKGDK